MEEVRGRPKEEMMPSEIAGGLERAGNGVGLVRMAGLSSERGGSGGREARGRVKRGYDGCGQVRRT